MKLLLSTICIGLLALFAYQVMSYPLEEDNAQGNKLATDLAKSVDYELPKLSVLNGIDNYSEIVLRPLFAKDRAARASAKVANKVTTVNELSHLILVGTASSTDVQIAIVADTKAKQMERLKVGENYDDWNISKVSTDYVVFQNNELEYKLFVTPIQGSQKDKQAKLVSQLNKSKIERATAAISSHQKLAESADKIQDKPKSKSKPKSKPKRSITERSWGYNKKYKPAKRSPIKVPGEEDQEVALSKDRNTKSREITADDFYNDEAISADELKLLEELGVKIFDE